MPKERRHRTELHAPSVRLHKRHFAVQDNATETVTIGAASKTSGNDILQALSEPTVDRPTITKKEKHQQRREAFLQKLTEELSPYSKSHTRRLKRKAKEQIAGGLGDIRAAITELEHDVEPGVQPSSAAKRLKNTSRNSKISTKSGRIGEGKGAPLSAGQRKRALELEQMRQPLILSDPTFASNPFQATRTHAQNTLIKQQTHS